MVCAQQVVSRIAADSALHPRAAAATQVCPQQRHRGSHAPSSGAEAAMPPAAAPRQPCPQQRREAAMPPAAMPRQPCAQRQASSKPCAAPGRASQAVVAEDELQVALLHRHARVVGRGQAAQAVARRLLHHARRDRGVEPRREGGGKLQDAGARIVLRGGGRQARGRHDARDVRPPAAAAAGAAGREAAGGRGLGRQPRPVCGPGQRVAPACSCLASARSPRAPAAALRGALAALARRGAPRPPWAPSAPLCDPLAAAAGERLGRGGAAREAVQVAGWCRWGRWAAGDASDRWQEAAAPLQAPPVRGRGGFQREQGCEPPCGPCALGCADCAPGRVGHDSTIPQGVGRTAHHWPGRALAPIGAARGPSPLVWRSSHCSTSTSQRADVARQPQTPWDEGRCDGPPAHGQVPGLPVRHARAVGSLRARPRGLSSLLQSGSRRISPEEWQHKLRDVNIRKEDMNRVVMNFLVTEVRPAAAAAALLPAACLPIDRLLLACV